MLTSRAVVLAVLAFGASLAAAAPERPYAPDLYARDRLTDEGESLVRRTVADAARPYSPDLFFRRALMADDAEEADAVEERTPTKTSSDSLHFVKRSSASLCRRDADCGGAHYCNAGSCYMRLAKRALCSRDSMCSSGFCGSKGACLEKRSSGASCKDSESACADGLFCSTVDRRCKQKRTFDQWCRNTEGCGEGLQCLNFKCKKAIFDEKKEKLDDALQGIQDDLNTKWNNWQDHFPSSPFPSGLPGHPHQFNKRVA